MSGTGSPQVQPSGVVNKVWAATGGSAMGGAVATIVIYFLDTNRVLSAEALPTTVTNAMATLISTFAALALGYYVRPGQNEVATLDRSGRPVSGMVGTAGTAA